MSPGLAKGRNLPAVDSPQRRGKKTIVRLSQRVCRRVPEHRLGGGVEQHDVLLGVEHHDRIHRGIDNRLHEPCLWLRETSWGP